MARPVNPDGKEGLFPGDENVSVMGVLQIPARGLVL